MVMRRRLGDGGRPSCMVLAEGDLMICRDRVLGGMVLLWEGLMGC